MKATYVFQFATENGKLIADSGLITINEAKALWEENYPKALALIKSGISLQMYLWKDMDLKYMYGETLIQIDNDDFTDGNVIYNASSGLPISRLL